MMQREGRQMSQHELGITIVSLKQLQGSTKVLGEVCENTLAATPESIGRALGHKILVTPYERIGTVVSPKGLSSVQVL